MSRDKVKDKARLARYRQRKHEERFGAGAGDQRGRHGNHARGARSGKWQTRIISSHGYMKVRVGRGHPLADPNGYAYEHLLVWVAAGNPRPDKDHTLHHANGDKLDNRLENLRLFLRSEHNAEHMKELARDPKTGRVIGKRAAEPECAR